MLVVQQVVEFLTHKPKHMIPVLISQPITTISQKQDPALLAGALLLTVVVLTMLLVEFTRPTHLLFSIQDGP